MSISDKNKRQFLEEEFIHQQDFWMVRITLHDQVCAPFTVKV
jgi:hypothetical protein